MTTRLGLMTEHEVKVGLAEVRAQERGSQGPVTEGDADPPPWSEIIKWQKVRASLGAAKSAFGRAERAAASQDYPKTVKELGEMTSQLAELAREAEQHTGREEAYLSLRRAASDLQSLARTTKD